MVKINIRDKNFGGEPSSCHNGVNKYVEWEFNNIPTSNSCFITDLCLLDVYKATNVKLKIAWILEPKAIHPGVYDWIEKNNQLFDFVLTFDLDLINKGENFLYYPHGRCWINGKSEYINTDKYSVPVSYKKDKSCSIIASAKNFTPGHQLRHQIIQQFNTQNLFDVYGYGYNPIDSKRQALDRYKFSITIENSIQPGYWTEKIVDCFATQTIPIFWGDSSINEHFNANGIIHFTTINELRQILNEINKNGHQIYNSKLKYIQENFQTVEKYRIPEDWLYINYPFLFN